MLTQSKFISKTLSPLVLLLAIFFTGCNPKMYLPAPDGIDTNRFGSYIMINHKIKEPVKGELIALDKNTIVVLREETNKCIRVQISEIEHFKIHYARATHYGWTIPTGLLASISHGIFALYTAPINLAVTIAVTVSGDNAFTYSRKDITYDKLKMFARFPQGVPSNIDIASIKYELRQQINNN